MKQTYRTLVLFLLFFISLCMENLVKESLFQTIVEGKFHIGKQYFRKPIFACISPYLFTVFLISTTQKLLIKKKQKTIPQSLLNTQDISGFNYEKIEKSKHKERSFFNYLIISLIPLFSISATLMIYLSLLYSDISILQIVHSVNITLSSIFSHLFTRHKLCLRQKLSVITFITCLILFSYTLRLENNFKKHVYTQRSIILYFISNFFIYISNVLEDKIMYKVIYSPTNNQKKLKQKFEPVKLTLYESIFGLLYSIIIIFLFSFYKESLFYEDIQDTLQMLKDRTISSKFVVLCLLSSLQKVISVIIVSETSPLQTFLSISSRNLVSISVIYFREHMNSKYNIYSFSCCIVSIILLALMF